MLVLKFKMDKAPVEHGLLVFAGEKVVDDRNFGMETFV
jgi:hypothetical protein